MPGTRPGMTNGRLQTLPKEKRLHMGAAFSSRGELADDDRRTVVAVVVVAVLLHDHHTLGAMIAPAVVMTMIAMALLDDHSLSVCGADRRGRQRNTEGSESSECNDNLAHKSSPLE